MVVHDAIATADCELISFAKNLRHPSIARVRRPCHCDARREILVVPVPEARTVVFGSAKNEGNFSCAIGGLALRSEGRAVIEPISSILVGATASGGLDAWRDL